MKGKKRNCLIIDISHGTTHDGPGIRTTVFLKGCPLHCRWCQNPESFCGKNEVWWDGKKCIGCNACIDACQYGAIIQTENGLVIDRKACVVCGDCVKVCPAEAMTFVGREWTLDGLVYEVAKDKYYYDESGGGVTVSGGEPLLQNQFVAAFFKKLQSLGITTALDICGFAPKELLEDILTYTDIVLYDIKLMDSELHKRFTSKANNLILSNLLLIAEYMRREKVEKGREMTLWIRTPLIPGATATGENISAIGTYINDNLMDVMERWELCAFNSLCKNKYDKIGLCWEYAGCGLLNQAFVDKMYTAAITGGVPKEKIVISGMVSQER